MLVKSAQAKHTTRKLEAKKRFQGFPISVETAKGSNRSGTDPDGHDWSIKMNCDYGYIRGTEGGDGEHLDVFLGPDQAATSVFIIRQIHPSSGKFDEDKVLLGFKSMPQALKTYLDNYDRHDHVDGIREIPLDAFKAMLRTHRGKRLTAPAYMQTDLKKVLAMKKESSEFAKSAYSLLSLLPGINMALASIKLAEEMPDLSRGLKPGKMRGLTQKGLPAMNTKARSVNVPGIPNPKAPAKIQNMSL